MEIGIFTDYYCDMKTEMAIRHLAGIGWLNVELDSDHDRIDRSEKA